MQTNLGKLGWLAYSLLSPIRVCGVVIGLVLLGNSPPFLGTHRLSTNCNHIIDAL